MNRMDRLDAELLRLLGEDVRTSVGSLAERLAVNRNTVQARLARLREGPLLTGWAPVVDLHAAGLHVQAFVQIELSQGAMTSVLSALRDIPQVLEVLATTGSADLLVRVATASNEALQLLLQEVLAVPGVVHTQTQVLLSAPVPYRVQPLLDHMTEGMARGRAPQ